MTDTTPLPRVPDGTPAHGQTVPAPHHKVNYLAIFILLVVLTVVTVVAAMFHIKDELTKILLALAIASVKACAVIFYFMHMKFEGKLIYLILIVPVVFCIVLIFALLPDITFGHIFHDFVANAWRFVQK